MFATTAGAVAPPGIPWRGPVGSPGGPAVPALCLAPWQADLCALTGIEAAYIMPYDFEFNQPAHVGSWWRPFFDGWVVNAPGGLEGLPLSYPAGYTPLYDDPALDFAAKVDELRIVVDPGTPHERVFVFDAPEVGFVRTVDYWGPFQWWTPAADQSTYVFFRYILPPLPPGVHVVEEWYSVSELHCDGLPSLYGEPLEDHCLPPGVLYRPIRARFEFAN